MAIGSRINFLLRFSLRFNIDFSPSSTSTSFTPQMFVRFVALLALVTAAASFNVPVARFAVSRTSLKMETGDAGEANFEQETPER